MIWFNSFFEVLIKKILLSIRKFDQLRDSRHIRWLATKGLCFQVQKIHIFHKIRVQASKSPLMILTRLTLMRPTTLLNLLNLLNITVNLVKMQRKIGFVSLVVHRLKLERFHSNYKIISKTHLNIYNQFILLHLNMVIIGTSKRCKKLIRTAEWKKGWLSRSRHLLTFSIPSPYSLILEVSI